MKIFKRVYYPIMAALFVLMLVLGMVDSRVGMSGGKLSSGRVDSAYSYAEQIYSAGGEEGGTHNSYQALSQQAVREYIVNTLTSADYDAQKVPGVGENDNLDDDGNNTANYFTDYEGNVKPSLYVQRATVTQESQDGGSSVVAQREIQNVILAIPGTGGDAILLHARYDSSAIGGASDAVPVGALLESATHALADFKSGVRHRNTLVYLFGDAGQEGDLGACAFVNQFVGFDNVASRVQAVADFNVGGTDGTLMVYSETDGNLGLIGKYASLNGSSFASSALGVLASRSDYSGSGAFGDYNTLDFTNRGGFNRYATASDVKLNRKLISQHANAMAKFVNAYADSDVSKLDSDSCAVYFSYLDVMTVYYPVSVAFVIAGIILGLVIAIIILNVRNKAFSWGKMLAGLAVQLLTLLATALTVLALYYLFALLLSGFGVLPFHALSAVKFSSGGLLIAALLLAGAFSVFYYIIFKRAFGIKAPDVVRGGVALFTVAAVVLSFALPEISYPFTCVALFALLALLMTVIFKKKFKAKTGASIEVLFLYAWPIIFALPLFMPLFFAAQTLYPAVCLTVILTLGVALMGLVTPYADYFKPVLDGIFGKLPERKVRYEREVTELVEDKAKKKKFTEQKVRKVVIEKEPWRYRNRIGLVFVSVVASVMIILFSSFSTVYSSSAVYAPSYFDSIYDDSLLFVYEKTESGTPDLSVEVHDQAAYNYIRYAVNDMSWNASKNAYVKEYTGEVSRIIPTAPDFVKSGDVINFSVFDSAYSQITVTLKNAQNVATVIVNEGDDNRESEEYTFSRQEEIVLRLPYGYEDFSLTLKNADGDAVGCDVEYEQHVYNTVNLHGIEGGDWIKLYDYYASNTEVAPALKSGIVIRLTKSIS